MIKHLVAALLSAVCTLAWAAGSATIQTEDGSTMVVEYDGTMVRMGADNADTYLLIRDGRLYSVTGNTVIDASSIMGLFADSLQAPGSDMSAIQRLQPTGRTETVAGVRGEVFLVEFTDSKGQQQQQEVVLSDDARAVELQQAWGTIASTLAAAGGNQASRQDFDRALGHRGILRYGDDMRISAISNQRPAAARFELPAEAQDTESLSKSISRALGQRTERQKEHVGRRTESELDQATGRTVDKALDKAFGKIFGR